MRSSSRYGLLLVAFAVIAFTSDLRASHAWGTYHWGRTVNPFTLQVGNNLSAAWNAALDVAIIDWNFSRVLSLVEVAGRTRPKTCRPTTGRIEVCNASYGNTNWLGIAQVWANGSHITQAVAKMNDTYFNTTTYNTPAWRQLVMCQEVAHDFGLGHQDEAFNNPNLGTCMDYTNNPGSNQHPNAHDYEQIEAIYAHTDSTTTVGATTPSAAPAVPVDLDSPGQWGRLVKSRGNGRIQLFEREFGNGMRVVTHVFWADPVGDAHH